LKSSNYIPEIICLLLFTCFSCLWVISHKQDEFNDTQLSPLIALETLIPQHKVQLLNANFSDQLHYDQLAQLQSEVEGLVFEVEISDTSKRVLKEYIDSSLGYTQLTSMLKTSQRLVSENSVFESPQFENLPFEDSEFENSQFETFQLEKSQLSSLTDNIRLKMFSFLSSPGNADKPDKAAIRELLLSIDTSNKEQANWQRLQLVKLHGIFILDNYELTASNRQKLIGMPVTEAVSKERALVQQQKKFITIKQFIGIFGAILALVALSVVVITRHQKELTQNSDKHEAFAKDIMDMLGKTENAKPE